MSLKELQPDVRDLVRLLGTTETVEVLVFLAGQPERSWSAPQLSAQLEFVGQVRPLLEKLARLNLADVRLGSDEILYRYAPSAAAANAVAHLLHVFREHRSIVIDYLRTQDKKSGVRA